MKTTTLIVAAILSAAVSGSRAGSPTADFTSATRNVWEQVGHQGTLIELKGRSGAAASAKPEEKAGSVRERFKAARNKSYSLERETGRLRMELNSLAERARDIADRRGRVDYSFDGDLDRFVWDLRDLSRDTSDHEAAIETLLEQAPREQSLLPEAKGLQKSLLYLVARLDGTRRDVSFARSAFVRIRKVSEADDIDRETAAAERSARAAWESSKAFTRELEAPASID